jgi:hypothetical protein
MVSCASRVIQGHLRFARHSGQLCCARHSGSVALLVSFMVICASRVIHGHCAARVIQVDGFTD